MNPDLPSANALTRTAATVVLHAQPHSPAFGLMPAKPRHTRKYNRLDRHTRLQLWSVLSRIADDDDDEDELGGETQGTDRPTLGRSALVLSGPPLGRQVI